MKENYYETVLWGSGLKVYEYLIWNFVIECHEIKLMVFIYEISCSAELSYWLLIWKL